MFAVTHVAAQSASTLPESAKYMYCSDKIVEWKCCTTTEVHHEICPFFWSQTKHHEWMCCTQVCIRILKIVVEQTFTMRRSAVSLVTIDFNQAIDGKVWQTNLFPHQLKKSVPHTNRNLRNSYRLLDSNNLPKTVWARLLLSSTRIFL